MRETELEADRRALLKKLRAVEAELGRSPLAGSLRHAPTAKPDIACLGTLLQMGEHLLLHTDSDPVETEGDAEAPLAPVPADESYDYQGGRER